MSGTGSLRGPFTRRNRLLLACVLAGSSLSAGISLVLAQPTAASPSVPYTDSTANGYIGLCNQQGQQIYSGNINTAPFVWRAVSSAPAASSVAGAGRTATLYAFQPIQGVDAAYWSGEQLTGSAVYSNPASPTVVATARDFALSNFLNVYHPMWDGFVELRIYLDAPGQPSYVASYPALNLYISGDTWQAVGGGTVNCDSGQAVSDESILPAVAKSASTTTPSSGSTSTSDPGSTATDPSGGTTSASQKGGSSSPSPSTASASASGEPRSDTAAAPLSARGSTNPAAPIGGVAAAVVLAGVVVAIVIRRRRRAAP